VLYIYLLQGFGVYSDKNDKETDMKKIILGLALTVAGWNVVLAQTAPDKTIRLQVIPEDKVAADYGVGMTCSFSLSQSGKPVFYESDTKKKAVIQIDGKLIELRQVAKGKWEGRGYKVNLQTKHVGGKGTDGTELKGTLVVKAKNGRIAKVTVWGGCEA
jgi:hypothetical protein